MDSTNLIAISEKFLASTPYFLFSIAINKVVNQISWDSCIGWSSFIDFLSQIWFNTPALQCYMQDNMSTLSLKSAE